MPVPVAIILLTSDKLVQFFTKKSASATIWSLEKALLSVPFLEPFTKCPATDV